MKTAAPGRCNGIIGRSSPTEASNRLFSVGYGVVTSRLIEKCYRRVRYFAGNNSVDFPEILVITDRKVRFGTGDIADGWLCGKLLEVNKKSNPTKMQDYSVNK
jgi:hypothetical protein